MLQHSNGHKSVTPPGYVAVIVFDELDVVAQSLLPRSLPGKDSLLMRQVEGRHFHPIPLSHMESQAAPSEAGFHHVFAGLKLKLSADKVHLGNLGIFERGGR